MFKQTFWAVIDPFWGEPRIVHETVRGTREEAKEAALWEPSLALYHGGSSSLARKGNWEKLAGFGYTLQEIDLVTK